MADEYVAHEEITYGDLPDGSKVTQHRFKHDEYSVAPWVYGQCEVYCGTCDKVVYEKENGQAALLALLVHTQAHLQNELKEMWVAVSRATGGRSA